MTIFEEGYAAHSKGQSLDSNPYDKLEQPYSFKEWIRGWKKALTNRQEKAR